jgi:hypothetical protein
LAQPRPELRSASEQQRWKQVVARAKIKPD